MPFASFTETWRTFLLPRFIRLPSVLWKSPMPISSTPCGEKTCTNGVCVCSTSISTRSSSARPLATRSRRRLRMRSSRLRRLSSSSASFSLSSGIASGCSGVGACGVAPPKIEPRAWRNIVALSRSSSRERLRRRSGCIRSTIRSIACSSACGRTAATRSLSTIRTETCTRSRTIESTSRPHVPDFGELGRFDLHKRRARKIRQAACDLRLPRRRSARSSGCSSESPRRAAPRRACVADNDCVERRPPRVLPQSVRRCTCRVPPRSGGA